MANNGRTPTQTEVTQIRAEWEAYRSECFLRPGLPPNYVWIADHEFDFHVVALHLTYIPDVHIELGDAALAFTAFEAVFIVPIARMSPVSLDLLRGMCAEPLATVQRRLRDRQQRVEKMMRFTSVERFNGANAVEAKPDRAERKQESFNG